MLKQQILLTTEIFFHEKKLFLELNIRKDKLGISIGIEQDIEAVFGYDDIFHLKGF